MGAPNQMSRILLTIVQGTLDSPKIILEFHKFQLLLAYIIFSEEGMFTNLNALRNLTKYGLGLSE